MKGQKTYDTVHMSYPVMCQHCRSVYDLTTAEHVARYSDCDVFKSPCCKRTVDTRPWKSLPDYLKLPRGNRVTEWDAL